MLINTKPQVVDIYGQTPTHHLASEIMFTARDQVYWPLYSIVGMDSWSIEYVVSTLADVINKEGHIC